MIGLRATAVASLLSLVVAAPQNCTLEKITPSKSLKWCPCEGQFFCAKLEVPLDYLKPSLGHASVPLLKIPAVRDSPDGPYQGMVLINPGGPGGPGTELARLATAQYKEVIGTNWDIVGFDPRGIGLSEPVIKCPVNVTALAKREVPRVTDDFYNEYIENGKILGKECERTSGGELDAGPHMTTATTARDMLSIVEAFAKTKDGKRAKKNCHLLNYHGVSYGTYLGQTFASMFPDRVGNFVLDGTVSPEGYIQNFTSPAITHLDGIFATFFLYCHEAGAACPYKTGTTPKDIFERFKTSLVQLDPRKAEAQGWSNATDLQQALLTLKAGILNSAYSPFDAFGLFSAAFIGLEDAIATHNLGPWIKQVQNTTGDPNAAGFKEPERLLGVLCSDQKNKFYGKTLEDFHPFIEDLEETSILGEGWVRASLGCVGWSIESDDVFSGPFTGRTKTPILFVGNTLDGVTPIENGVSSAPNYRNAQVLTIDGTGHTAWATQNKCAVRKTKAYFQTNQLPGNDSYCPLEVGQFNVTLKGTLKENIAKAGLADLHF